MKINIGVGGQQHQLKMKFADIKKSNNGNKIIALVQQAVDEKILEGSAKSILKKEMRGLKDGICFGYSIHILSKIFNDQNNLAILQNDDVKEMCIQQAGHGVRAAIAKKNYEMAVEGVAIKVDRIASDVLKSKKKLKNFEKKMEQALKKAGFESLLRQTFLGEECAKIITDTAKNACPSEYKEKFIKKIDEISLPAAVKICDSICQQLQLIGMMPYEHLNKSNNYNSEKSESVVKHLKESLKQNEKIALRCDQEYKGDSDHVFVISRDKDILRMYDPNSPILELPYNKKSVKCLKMFIGNKNKLLDKKVKRSTVETFIPKV